MQVLTVNESLRCHLDPDALKRRCVQISIYKLTNHFMNKKYLIGGSIILLIIIFVVVSQSGSSQMTPGQAVAPAPIAPTSIAGTSTLTTTQDPEDIVPGLYANPIVNKSTKPGIKITGMLVENNTDSTGKPVSDHLQFTLQNLTTKSLSSFEVYYTILDSANGKKEGYYKQLSGFTLAPKGIGTVHFDGQSGVGHYAANTNGIYGTATDKLSFAVEVSVPGYAPVHATIVKAPGGAEVVGQ